LQNGETNKQRVAPRLARALKTKFNTQSKQPPFNPLHRNSIFNTRENRINAMSGDEKT
jgi:hypothetical protein